MIEEERIVIINNILRELDKFDHSDAGLISALKIVEEVPTDFNISVKELGQIISLFPKESDESSLKITNILIPKLSEDINKEFKIEENFASENRTLLNIAAIQGKVEVFKNLLKNGAQANNKTYDCVAKGDKQEIMTIC